MSWGAVAGAAVSVVGGSLMGGASQQAAGVQSGASAEQIAELQRQFGAYQKAVSPYTGAGTDALSQQRVLLGLGGGNRPDVESFIRQSTGTAYDNGYRLGDADRAGVQEGAIGNYRAGQYGSADDALKLFGYQDTAQADQAAAMSAFENSPYFQAISKQSENAILQNASATGGLRGGNVQDALAKNRPILLQNLIDKQLQNLQGLSSQGLGAATNLGNAGLQTASMIGQAGQQGAAAQAGGILGQSNADISALGNVGGLFANKLAGSGSLFSGSPVVDGGYSIGQGSAYGGTRAGL